MKKLITILFFITSCIAAGGQLAKAGKPAPGPCDGYADQTSCEADCLCEWTQSKNRSTCEAATLDSCGGDGSCYDGDGDGFYVYDAFDCPTGNDCDDSNPAVNPGATEVCENSLDDDCNAGDALCNVGTHANIIGNFNTPADVTTKCLECHGDMGTEVVNSLHGMMVIPTPNVENMTESQKLNEINTFCSYPNPGLAGSACLGCHPTLGKYENLAPSDIDCLRCHNDAYKRKFTSETDPSKYWNVVDWQGAPKTYIPSAQDTNGNYSVEFDWAAMPGLTAGDLIAGVHRPTTTTCLSCHAKAGGGDWTKRGDLGLSSSDPSASEDIHLASIANGGAGLSCADCHTPSSHQIPGRGIDLRPSEGESVKTCVDCHIGMDQGGHAAAGKRSEPDRHVARVSCQSCHIPTFGKGGANGTELSRNWQEPHWNQTLCNGQGAWAGYEYKEKDVVPDHVWFDGTSYVYGVDQVLGRVDPISGFDTLADAHGDAKDALGVSKLVPIKRHQSNMAVMDSGADSGKVIPYDVVWQFMTGRSEEAAENGKTFAGYSGTHEWRWLEAEMAINHGVSPASGVTDCKSCHHDRGQFNYTTETKLDKLGYKLKDTPSKICSQCHLEKSFKRDWEQMHAHTQKGSGIGCTFCHDVERPERGLCEPCNPDGSVNSECINEFVDTNYYEHCTP